MEGSTQTSFTDKHRPVKEFLYKDLTYNILGALFEVNKELGFGYKEKVYQEAVAKELEGRKIKFVRENYSKVSFKGSKVGGLYHDFLIENKVVLEIKVGNELYDSNIKQLLIYLNDSGVKIGILAAFTPNGLTYKRLAY